MKEVLLPRADPVFPSPDACDRHSRRVAAETDTSANMLPVELDSGPNPTSTAGQSTDEGRPPAAETIYHNRNDLPPQAPTSGGAEIETDSLPATAPATFDFAEDPYSISECGKLGIIGN